MKYQVYYININMEELRYIRWYSGAKIDLTTSYELDKKTLQSCPITHTLGVF